LTDSIKSFYINQQNKCTDIVLELDTYACFQNKDTVNCTVIFPRTKLSIRNEVVV